MCTVLRHRHPARTRADRTQLTRRELTCDGGKRTATRYSRELQRTQNSQAARTLCLRHHVLGPSVSRRPPRCFGRCDRLRQRAPICTAARPRRRGPVRPWLIAVCSWRCGSVVRSVGVFTHVRGSQAPGTLRPAGALAPSLCSSLSRLPPQRLPHSALVTTFRRRADGWCGCWH